MKTVGSPKEFWASDLAREKDSSNSSSFRTTRIPRPPPPMAALMIMGKPMSFTNCAASVYFSMAEGVPGTMGTEAF